MRLDIVGIVVQLIHEAGGPLKTNPESDMSVYSVLFADAHEPRYVLGRDLVQLQKDDEIKFEETPNVQNDSD